MDKGENNQETFTINDVYNKIQMITLLWNDVHCLRYITSRSTKENLDIIQILCLEIQDICYSFYVQTEGVSLKNNESYINVFKYLICNTSFASQLLLADDTASGHLVDIQPPFSPYLLIEILWNLCCEDILTESILYFPLDLCVDILEILPRCIDLLDFQRASKFLATLIPNVYKKLIIMKDTGSQTEDIVQNCKKLTRNLQELILQFTNKRFLKFEDIIVADQYKRYGILLKTIIKLVRKCFIGKFKKIELECEVKKLYNLTFGWKPFKKLDDSILQELLTEIDRELTSLLLNKIKKIDCNIYLNWTEYNDEESTSLTLQQAIGLECHFFIENTKDFNYSNVQEYSHLIECLEQIASKPDLKDNVDNLKRVDLLHGVSQGNVDCLIELFQTDKEWNTSLLTKEICIGFIDHFAEKFDCKQVQSYLEILQTNLLFFIKGFIHLNIAELYEVTIKCILKFSENEEIQNIIDISSIETFIIYNPNFSNEKNLKVILFFLCLKTRFTLKILLKMVIGHSDYSDVAISLDDLMLLVPILKIRTLSKCKSIMETLSKTCFENKQESYKQWFKLFENKQYNTNKPNTVTLAVQILQEICLKNTKWNAKKLTNLISILYSFCTISEIVKEILTPLLMSCIYSCTYLKCTLVELQKLIGIHDFGTTTDLAYVLQRLAVYLLHSSYISKYIVDELMTLITELNECFCVIYKNNEHVHFNDYTMFLGINNINSDKFLDIIGAYMSLLQNRFFYLNEKYPIHMFNDNIISYLFLKSTKRQYLKYTNEIITSYGNFFKWATLPKIYDHIIRLTFESCFLCLEFPDTCSFDNISFLINCLIHFLETLKISEKNNRLHQKLCKSLDTQILIFKHTIEYTAIADSYAKLLKKFEKSTSNLKAYLAALKHFTFSCTKENEKLKSFNGPHSDIAIKLWLGNKIISTSVNIIEFIDNERYIKKLDEYFM